MDVVDEVNEWKDDVCMESYECRDVKVHVLLSMLFRLLVMRKRYFNIILRKVAFRVVEPRSTNKGYNSCSTVITRVGLMVVAMDCNFIK